MSVRDVVQAAAGALGGATYIEDVFSTYVYTANNQTAQTITNGIDLSGEGGLVWIKTRSAAYEHFLADTARGAANYLQSQSTAAQINNITELTSFNSNGFSLGTDSSGIVNFGSTTLVSWTFRKAEKFFDVVTYTGNGVDPRAIAHSLGSVPGFIVVKRTNSGGSDWLVYHRSLATGQLLSLNATYAAYTTNEFTTTPPTSTVFYVANSDAINGAGYTYVAYLFAHDAGGFGDDGSENVITCGSYVGNGGTTTPNQISIGFEPQWLLIKASSTTSNWAMGDVMRGMYTESGGTAKYRELLANTTGSEGGSDGPAPTATGFAVSNTGLPNASGVTYIYIAIRRGPMKTPESGTEVFSPNVATSGTVTTNFPIDMQILSDKGSNNSILNQQFIDRLRGVSSTSTQQGVYLLSSSTAAESSAYPYSSKQWSNTGFGIPQNYEGASSLYLSFRRAPGFFDVVCYTGDGTSTRSITHNLTVAPELLIVKRRATGLDSWYAYAPSGNLRLLLNTDLASPCYNAPFSGTTPTATTFSYTSNDLNQSGFTFVAYLFATCPGVSKVFSYTGNGSSQTINCGFTGGARFVLIKRTDSTGNWTVFDSARGIVAGNDPALYLNSTAAEVTTADAVDTDSTGFIVNQESTLNLNVSSATYIFLAIA